MKQLALDFNAHGAADFANFVAGDNREAYAHLQALAQHPADTPAVFLWGLQGAGKTHLLCALAAAAKAHGHQVLWVDATRTRLLPELEGDAPAGAATLLLIDNVDRAHVALQADCFRRLVTARPESVVVTSTLPPALLPMREDLATRLLQGLTWQIMPLTESATREAIVAHARSRGFIIGPEIVDYLIHHTRRDMPSLVAALEALDQASREAKRPITLPLARSALAQGEALNKTP